MPDTATIPRADDPGVGMGGEHVMRWIRAINEWTAWLRAAGKSAQTIALRRLQIRKLAESNVRRSPWRITTADLAEWLGRSDWAPSTRHSYRAALVAFYKWARLTGKVRRDPAESLPPVKRPRQLPRPTPDDVLEHVRATASDRIRLAVYLAGFAGLRRGEIATLPWSAVTREAITVTGKGGHTRRVPLHPILAADLERERALRAAGTAGTGWRYTAGLRELVFPGQSGEPTNADTLTKHVTAALGGGGWTLHTLRHRFATRALAGSGNLAAVQDLLGHASPVTTRTYAALSDDALTAAVLTV